jgi:hypothetical protein
MSGPDAPKLFCRLPQLGQTLTPISMSLPH